MYPHEQSDPLHERIARSESPASDKDTCPARFPSHRGEVLRFMQRSLGGGIIVSIKIITILLWLLFRPPSQPTSRYLGEILGTTAIVLFSCRIRSRTALAMRLES